MFTRNKLTVLIVCSSVSDPKSVAQTDSKTHKVVSIQVIFSDFKY